MIPWHEIKFTIIHNGGKLSKKPPCCCPCGGCPYHPRPLPKPPGGEVGGGGVKLPTARTCEPWTWAAQEMAMTDYKQRASLSHCRWWCGLLGWCSEQCQYVGQPTRQRELPGLSDAEWMLLVDKRRDAEFEAISEMWEKFAISLAAEVLEAAESESKRAKEEK